MKLGVILPSFRDSPSEALAIADQAAATEGVSAVFAYDHLFPLGAPQRPALAPFPLLAAIAAKHPDLFVGPLVARVGLTSNAVLVSQFAALDAISPGKVIAGLGLGDAQSAAETTAYGISFAPLDERREALRQITQELQHRGQEIWLGGSSSAVVDLATAREASINLWAASPETVASFCSRCTVTWAGLSTWPASQGLSMHEGLRALKAAGATWAVFGWPGEAAIADPEVLLGALAEFSRFEEEASSR
ncbi:MAG: LLM class flavin-dependent oxidoreductase [Actinomycetes bacterium]